MTLWRRCKPPESVPEVPPPAELTMPPGLMVPSPSVDHSKARDNGELMMQILLAGKPFLVAGLSLIGEHGYIVRSVGIYEGVDRTGNTFQGLRGWTVHAGHPKHRLNRLRYIDSRQGDANLALPNTMVYLVGEVDPKLLDESADHAKVEKIIEYAMAQIHD